VRIDKGAGIAAFLEDADVDAAVYVGDDVTDLDAFRALTEMQQSGRLRRAVKAGVSSDDGPSEITSEADIVVDGTSGVQELLATLISDD
jgi:trehalose 6-phosphate phosphatase